MSLCAPTRRKRSFTALPAGTLGSSRSAVSHKGGKAAATNYGLRFATGDIIGIFDADHALDRGLAVSVAPLRNRAVGCVRGRCRTVNRTLNLVTH